MHATDLVCSFEIKQQHFRVLLRANSQTGFTGCHNTIPLVRLLTVNLNRAARHLNPRVTQRVHRVFNFLTRREYRSKQTHVLMDQH